MNWLQESCCAQGMGEGEGKKDVSDQIQDEDQLLGAQQKDQPPPDSKVHTTVTGCTVARGSKPTLLLAGQRSSIT